MNSCKNSKYSFNIKTVFFIVYTFVLLVIGSGDYIVVPHLSLNSIYIYIALFSIVLFYFFIKKDSINADVINFLLLFRIGIYLIPLIYIYNTNGFFGNYFSVIASLMTYLVFSSKNIDNYSSYNRLIKFIIIITFIQTIITAININSTGKSIYYKLYMETPIGSSNFIGCIILPMIVFIIFFEEKKYIKSLIIILGLITLILIRSKNALIVFLIFIVYFLIKKLVKSFFNLKNYMDKRLSIFLICFISFFILTIAFFIVKFVLNKFYMGIQLDGNGILKIINAFSSGRLDVYLAELTRWSNNPLFGGGMVYKVGEMRAHNWIIEALVQSGILGLTVFFILLCIWYRKIKFYIKKDKFIRACFISVIAILLQGLFEVSIFTTSIDILLWIFIGLSISKVNKLKYNYDKKVIN